MRATSALVALLVLAGSAAIVTGCGSSNKPAVCAKRDELKKSVSELKSFNILAEGPKGLQQKFGQIESDAEELANAARSDFPEQSKQLSDAVGALAQSVQRLRKQGSSSPAITKIPGQVQAVIATATDLDDEINKECGD